MGKRGPKPKPSSLQRMQGTYRADRRRGEPVAVSAPARKPPWVKGLAAKHWGTIAPWLKRSNLLTSLDAVACGLLCDALADYLEAGEVVEQAAVEGGVKFVATTDKGNIIQHPAVGVRNKAWERAVKLLREFGMTPSARAGLHLSEGADKANPKTRLFKVVG